MDKEDVVHMYNGLLLSHKKEQNNAICSNMDGPRDYHISEVRKRKTNICYHLYAESKEKIQINLFTKHKQPHIENKFMVTKGERGGIN